MEDKNAELATELLDENAVELNQQLPIEPSKPYIGRWNTLVSQTNWEKGKLICEWRAALETAEAESGQYSDDSWSRMVGDVTPQHVGRLRRTYHRFAGEYEQYSGLYWSHFFAALDWDDAPMWLEGAMQNRWSVSRMRRQRWETLGKIPEHEPRIADVIVSELDEGFQPLQFEKQVSSDDALGLQSPSAKDRDFQTGPRYDEPDFGDEPGAGDSGASASDSGPGRDESNIAQAETSPEKLFENLAELPDDVAEATESMKLSVLRHKMSEWEEISQEKMLQLLDALKKLAQTAV